MSGSAGGGHWCKNGARAMPARMNHAMSGSAPALRTEFWDAGRERPCLEHQAPGLVDRDRLRDGEEADQRSARIRLLSSRCNARGIDGDLLQLRRQHADYLDAGVRHQLRDLLQADLRHAARYERADAAIGAAGGEPDLGCYRSRDAEPLEQFPDVRDRDATSGRRRVADRFCSKRARLSASGEDTSGRGASLRTAMPMPVRATSVRPGRTLPCLMRSSSAPLSMMMTSAGSPATKRRARPPDGP